jgi:hypothetical protein
VVENQIDYFTPNPSFDHNLCFNYSNWSCEPISNIYVPTSFQWYNELFNPMGFDPCITLWKFGSPLGFQLPKWELALGVCRFIPSHSPTLLGTWNVTSRLHSWPTPLQTLALVVSPRLGLRYWTYVRRFIEWMVCNLFVAEIPSTKPNPSLAHLGATFMV